MTITPIAFQNSGVDIVSDSDLAVNYPTLPQDIWTGAANYRVQLIESFNRAIRDVTANDSFSDASLIPNSATNIAWFKQTVIEAAYSRIFLSFMLESGDRWHVLHQYHERQYLARVQNIKIDYDTNEDGTVSDSESSTSSTVEFVR